MPCHRLRNGAVDAIDNKKTERIMCKQIITELHLIFKGVDNWSRPVFKRIDKNHYFGDTNNLFSWDASKEEVMEFYKDKDLHNHLCYFGTSFGCEPSGTSIRKEIKIFIE